MAEVTIRPYEVSDWPVICDIHDRARPIELKGSCDEKAFIPLAEETDDIENFNDAMKFVACLHSKVVGFVGIDRLEVTWLYVDPGYFGQGIGRRLLQHGLALIGEPATTYVLSGNQHARQLYGSEGFQQVKAFQSHNHGYPCTVFKLVQI